MATSGHGRLTAIEAALEQLLETVPRITEAEMERLGASCGRVLAQALVAPASVPPHANSAMDGFAVHSGDTTQTPVILPVTQRIPAGRVGDRLAAGEAARIFTGAPLPPGADAVVMQENASLRGSTVTIEQGVSPGENVRPAGEDIEAGQQLFPAGHRLRAQDLAVLASVGIDRVLLVRALRIAVLNTGDELVAPGSKLADGQIYNSSGFMLGALIEALGAEQIELGVIADDPVATQAALAEAAEQADCVLSTGGVSVGEEDHVKAAVEALGSLDLWRLAIKPGKPFASGRINDTQFFGLPGNPVSAFVTFVMLVRPCLLAMQGCRDTVPLSLPVAAGFSIADESDRQEYLRVTLEGDRAAPLLRRYDNQSSGVAASLSGSDGLAIVPPHTRVESGDILTFIPFSELLH